VTHQLVCNDKLSDGTLILTCTDCPRKLAYYGGEYKVLREGNQFAVHEPYAMPGLEIGATVSPGEMDWQDRITEIVDRHREE